MRVLLTNDDGIWADGLQTLRRALLAVPDVELAVIAPDGNRSATARSITTSRPLWVERVEFDDGTHGYASDGTPVDCVRLAKLGLIDGFEAEAVVSGINHGTNLGDDITYSGTVAAALEGIVLGVPAIAVSQDSRRCRLDIQSGDAYEFEAAAAFVSALIQRLEEVPLRSGTLLNVNVPGRQPQGVAVAGLGKRIYRDELHVHQEDGDRVAYRIYGGGHGYEEEPDTDLAAVAAGRIAVTPLHLDLTDRVGLETLRQADLAKMVRAAAGDPS